MRFLRLQKSTLIPRLRSPSLLSIFRRRGRATARRVQTDRSSDSYTVDRSTEKKTTLFRSVPQRTLVCLLRDKFSSSSSSSSLCRAACRYRRELVLLLFSRQIEQGKLLNTEIISWPLFRKAFVFNCAAVRRNYMYFIKKGFDCFVSHGCACNSSRKLVEA